MPPESTIPDFGFEMQDLSNLLRFNPHNHTHVSLANYPAHSLTHILHTHCVCVQLCPVSVRALAPGLIGAGTFTGVRLLSGAVVLMLLVALRGRATDVQGGWGSAVALFAYAAPFSFAYLRIPAGVGALVLFGTVQATMIGSDLLKGKRLRSTELAGLVLAVAGLTVLTLPGVSAPDPAGVGLMIVAGVAWGIYSLRGRAAIDPLKSTATNFSRSLFVRDSARYCKSRVRDFHTAWRFLCDCFWSNGFRTWLCALVYSSSRTYSDTGGHRSTACPRVGSHRWDPAARRECFSASVVRRYRDPGRSGSRCQEISRVACVI